MIHSATIKNLRGIRRGRLDALAPLVIIVGPAGSGKSTVLDALNIGANPKPREAAALAVRRHGLPAGVRWLLWKGGEEGPAQISVSTLGGETRTCRFKGPQDGSKGRGQKAEKPAPAEFTGLTEIPEVRLVDGSLRRYEARIHELFLQAMEQGTAKEVIEQVGEILPRLLTVEVVGTDKPVLHVVFHGSSLPLMLAGDNVRRFFRLCLELATCPRGLILLEEPEAHQHPAVLRQTARAILSSVERGLQVVLTTQSLELVDALLGESAMPDLNQMVLFRLLLEGGRLDSSALPGGDVALMRQCLEEDFR